MSLLSGFAGACMTEDGFVKAQMAWGVAEKEDKVNVPAKGKGKK